MEAKKQSETLYDVGGVFIIAAIIGLPLGSIIDYLWNLAVLSNGLLFLGGPNPVKVSGRRRLVCAFFMTLLGLIIDWAYFELAWDTDFGGRNTAWIPAMSQGIQFVWLLLPMAMLALVNFALAYSFLKLDRKQSIIMGVVIGVLTAPWLLPTIPYLLGWVT
jgi:hypothetical protein